MGNIENFTKTKLKKECYISKPWNLNLIFQVIYESFGSLKGLFDFLRFIYEFYRKSGVGIQGFIWLLTEKQPEKKVKIIFEESIICLGSMFSTFCLTYGKFFVRLYRVKILTNI